MTILVVSAFMEQYRQFDGVSNVFDDTGIMVYANLQDKEGNPITPQRYKEVLKKVENVEMPFSSATAFICTIFSMLSAMVSM